MQTGSEIPGHSGITFRSIRSTDPLVGKPLEFQIVSDFKPFARNFLPGEVTGVFAPNEHFHTPEELVGLLESITRVINPDSTRPHLITISCGHPVGKAGIVKLEDSEKSSSLILKIADQWKEVNAVFRLDGGPDTDLITYIVRPVGGKFQITSAYPGEPPPDNWDNYAYAVDYRTVDQYVMNISALADEYNLTTNPARQQEIVTEEELLKEARDKLLELQQAYNYRMIDQLIQAVRQPSGKPTSKSIAARRLWEDLGKGGMLQDAQRLKIPEDHVSLEAEQREAKRLAQVLKKSGMGYIERSPEMLLPDEIDAKESESTPFSVPYGIFAAGKRPVTNYGRRLTVRELLMPQLSLIGIGETLHSQEARFLQVSRFAPDLRRFVDRHLEAKDEITRQVEQLVQGEAMLFDYWLPSVSVSYGYSGHIATGKQFKIRFVMGNVDAEKLLVQIRKNPQFLELLLRELYPELSFVYDTSTSFDTGSIPARTLVLKPVRTLFLTDDFHNIIDKDSPRWLFYHPDEIK